MSNKGKVQSFILKRIIAGIYTKLIKQSPSVIPTKRHELDIAKTDINKDILMAD